MRPAWALLAAVALSCAGASEPPGPRGKPHAPVEIALGSVPIGGGLHQVTIEGRALADLASLELVVAAADGTVLARAEAGPTAAGVRRELSVAVAGGPGVEIVGGARTPQGARATSLALGTPAAKPAPRRVVVTPFGPVAEAGE